MTSLKNKQSFYLGTWLVTPDQNKIKNLQQEIFIEPKLMEVLNYLSINAPAIVSINTIIENCWPNQFVSDNPLHKCIAQLRKVLGDTIKNPQYIKTISKKGYAIVADIKGIDSGVPLNRAKWHDHVPYLGIKPYSLQQQVIFFGRSKAIAEIKSLLNNIVKIDLPLLVIGGLSTAGKTSLINTSIIPYLETQDRAFKYSYKDALHYDLAFHTNSYVVKDFINYLVKTHIFNAWLDTDKYLLGLKQSLQDLKTPSQVDTLAKHNELKLKHNPIQKIIFIDHFEKILIEQEGNQDELNLMILIILQLLNTGDYFIVIASGIENYHTLEGSVAFNSVKQKILHYHLAPPNNFEIAEIVQKPVIAAGLRYEFNESTFESLDKIIIDDARNMGNILPILSHTLKELCENCNEKQQLTFDIYHKIGRLTGALTYKVENILSTLSDDEKSLFTNNLHHFIQYNPSIQKEYVTIKTNIKLLKDDKLFRLINYLTEHGVLQSHKTDSQIFVSILHDFILQECAFFKNWIAENHLKLSIITEVKTLASQWLGSDENKEYLLHNTYLLEQTTHLIKEDTVKFSPNQSRFLNLSRWQQNKRIRLKLLSVAMLALLLVFSVILLAINKQTSADLVTTNNNAENLITFMIGDLKDKLRPIGHLDLLQIVGSQIIDYYDNRPESVQSEQSLLQYNRALNTIGEVEVNQGRFNKAKNIFKLAISQDLSFFKTDAAKISAFFSYGQSNFWLGNINYLQNNFELTQQYWSIYLDLSEQLLSMQPDNNAWKLEYSYALNNLGTLNYQQSNFSKAEHYFNLSADLKKELLGADPNNTQYIAELADTISWQANIFDKRNELLVSNAMYIESLHLTEKLIKMDEDNKAWQHNLARANYQVAVSHFDLGELIKVKYYLAKSLPIYIQLNDFDITNQVWIKELINNYIYVSRVYRHNQDFDSASLNIKKAMAAFDSYSLGSKQLETAQVQALYLNADMSMITLHLGQNKTALDQINNSINHFNSFDTSQYVNENFLKAQINFVLANIKLANHHTDEAELLLTEALILLNNDKLKAKDKKYMALYVTIEKTLGVENPSQEMINYLKEIKYKNPEYIINPD